MYAREKNMFRAPPSGMQRKAPLPACLSLAVAPSTDAKAAKAH